MSSTILIIDDDQKLNKLLTEFLGDFGFNTLTATHPQDGLKKLKHKSPDLVILDVMLPGMDGFEVCKTIRQNSSVPIIMLTARGELMDRVVGLELGADDYLPKPFEPEEMVARVHALLRRAVAAPVSPAATDTSAIQLDEDAMEVTIHGKTLDLRPLEFKLLQVLMKKPGKVRSREYLLDHVWGINSFVELRTVDVTVKRLRKALESCGFSDAIKTVRGAGYRYSESGKSHS